MTKPSDFVFNTDYLPIAQDGQSKSYTAYFTSETFQAGQTYDRYVDFTTTPVKGAIDRIMISHNGSNYTVGNNLTVDVSPTALSFSVYRTSPSNIRVRMHVFYQNAAYTQPSQTIAIKVSSFQPPNVF